MVVQQRRNRNPENLLAKGVWWKARVRRSYVVSQGTTDGCQEKKKKARSDFAASLILAGVLVQAESVQGPVSMTPVD